MPVLDFESYKNTGKIEYVSGSNPSNRLRPDTEAANILQEQEALDSLASVMEMSTDELIGELTVRNATGQSLREIKTADIVEELSQRMIAIEYILMITLSSSEKD